MILLTIILLAIMEVSLSFDNAVLNASILKDMPKVWQDRFLLWGMPIAVMGMRLILPVVIVYLASGMITIQGVVQLAINAPEEYAKILMQSQKSIDAFGGMFLLMVFLKFIFEEKEIYWLTPIEKRLAALGKLESLEIVICLGILIALQNYAVFIPGALGIMLYVFINGIMGDAKKLKSGLSAFIYLEILDASCSFDGVIAAFVLTTNIFYIMIGLGIGALAIRSLTLYLVRGGKLAQYAYLEHGAHYGIGALAIIMIIDIFHSVPEPVTGMIGIAFIGLSLLSSIRENKK